MLKAICQNEVKGKEGKYAQASTVSFAQPFPPPAPSPSSVQWLCLQYGIPFLVCNMPTWFSTVGYELFPCTYIINLMAQNRSQELVHSSGNDHTPKRNNCYITTTITLPTNLLSFSDCYILLFAL